MKLHFGPGKGWEKPSDDWKAVDVDSERGDIVLNLNQVDELPFEDSSVDCIYGSHIFEHVSILNSLKIFKECYRILKPGGIIRIVVPDARRSIEEYLAGNEDYFKKKIERLERLWKTPDYTMFEALREDFISRSNQKKILGHTLAHQNAWDFESLKAELTRAGFPQVKQQAFQVSDSNEFGFEGDYKAEANNYNYSLYVEAIK